MKKLLVLTCAMLFVFSMAGTALAVPIVINISPGGVWGSAPSTDPIYSGDTVTIEVLPFIGNTEYFEWANMQASAETGLVDVNGPMSAVINGMNNEINTFGEGGGYYSLNAFFGEGVTYLPDSYGGAWGSDPSTVSGTISFVAGLPGTYHFSTTFDTGNLNMHSSFNWWQPSQLISPPWGEVYITVLEGSGSTGGGGGGDAIPEPGTMMLLGSGLIGLIGVRRNRS